MRFLITVPLEITLEADDKKDARFKLMQIKDKYETTLWSDKGAINSRIRSEKSKVKDLPF